MKIFILLFIAIPVFVMGQDGFTPGEKLNDHRSKKLESPSKTDFKKELDLSHNIIQLFGSQGFNRTSCWAYASAYYFSYMFGKSDGISFDPEYIFRKYSLPEMGCNTLQCTADILDSLLQNGALPLELSKPLERKCSSRPTSDQEKTATKHRQGNYRTVITKYTTTDVNNLKLTMNQINSPFIISMKVDDYFMKSKKITKDNPNWKEFGYEAGNHAMLVVGYNSEYFKVLNSFGSDFGDSGYVWIANSIIQNYTNYICYAVKITEGMSPQDDDSTEPGNEIWIKAGYYREFEGLKIICHSIQKSNQYAILQISDGQVNSDNIHLNVGDSIEIELNSKMYRLSVNNIRRAGNFLNLANPYAVFYTIVKL